MNRTLVSLGLSAAFVVVSAPRVVEAAPPTRRACADAYANTQTLRKAGKTSLAHDQAVICSQTACPKFVSDSCTAWLEEIERSVPTIVIGARGAQGQDLSDVGVTLDGKPFAAKITGEAVPVDPGEHVLVFDHAGDAPVELKIVVREGEKNRHVDASFAPVSAVPSPLAPVAAQGPSASSDATTQRFLPAVFTLGGITVAGLGVFATFAGLGLSQKSGFETSCAPHCPLSDASSVHTKLVVGDVGLFTAIGAAVAGTVVFMVGRPTSAPPAVSFRVTTAPSGGFAVAATSF